jgi:hypothetical protein
MSDSNTVALERIDHGVLPSNDLGKGFRFWSSFMGARLNFHANLNARGLNREVPMIVFFTVANHPGFGLALQDFRLPAMPARPLEGVVWGFEVAANDWLARRVKPKGRKFIASDAPSILHRVRSKNLCWCSIRTATQSSSASGERRPRLNRRQARFRCLASAMCA